jgi:hypothetical protein
MPGWSVWKGWECSIIEQERVEGRLFDRQGRTRYDRESFCKARFELYKARAWVQIVRVICGRPGPAPFAETTGRETDSPGRTTY